MQSYHVWPFQVHVYQAESYGFPDFGVLHPVQEYHIGSL